MANINNYFPAGGDWLRADDIRGPVKATIKEVKPIQVPDFNDKTVSHPALEISFVGAEKTFVCKKMNAQAIAQGYGPDTDGWIGKKIILKKTVFQNGKEGLIAEADVPVSEGFGPPPAQQFNQDIRPAPPSADLDDDIPF